MTLTTERAGAYAIEEVTLASLSDDELRPIGELAVAWTLEAMPDDPPTPVEVAMSRMRATPKLVIRRDWVARDGSGTPVARANVVRFDAAENQNFRETTLHVLPAHRRRGLGRALFGRVVEGAGENDAIVLTGGSITSAPDGEAFAKRIGAKSTLGNRISQAELAAIDRAMVREWAALDPQGYRLVWIDGDVPDELVDNVIVAYDQMNTAPREDMKMDDWKMTAEVVRQFDASRRASGQERRLLLALHESGETGGFTEVSYHPSVPHVVAQQGTAVVPSHRGHGLGKWLKAAMIERILAEWPQAKLIRTGNAYSNAPMLSINDRLGFTVAWSGTVWQITLAKAKEYLGRD